MNQRPDVVLNRMSNYYTTLANKIKNSNKDEKEDIEDDLNVLDTLFDCLSDYTQSVFKHEDAVRNFGQLKDKYQSNEEFLNKVGDLDRHRKFCHDRLINNIALIDRLCKHYGVQPIYGELGEYENNSSTLLDVKNYRISNVLKVRKELSSWATDFTVSCTAGISLGIDIDGIENTEDLSLLESVACEMRKFNSARELREIVKRPDIDDISI